MSDALSLFTIGHSTHSFEWFLALLSGAGIEAVADVRTAPVSRFCPQFNKARLDEALRAAGLSYAFLGKELGGRPDDPALYTNGIADFERMAKSAAFHKGIDRVIVQARERRLALMCSEKHPLDCHRCLLVGRALAARGAAVQHILSDGTQTEQREIEEHLLAGSEDDLFTPRAERLAAAYHARTRKVAFAKK
ncbi:MAG: DUF488 domain-containing protein [Alphaproteobacteria bacterium]|nr:DUF488 domain-containing protein [Alphaproteobacteria bacterium]